MTNAALITPRDGATGNGPGLPAAMSRRQREAAYRDAQLASKRDLAKREDRRLTPIEIINWCIGRCRELGLTSAATRLLELIARQMGNFYALHDHTLAQLGRMLDWSRQRASAVYKILEAVGVVVRVGKSFYFRPGVLEAVPVLDRRRTRLRGESVNSPLRRRDKQKELSKRTENPAPAAPSNHFTEDKNRDAWAAVISAEPGSAAYLAAQRHLKLSDEDMASWRS